MPTYFQNFEHFFSFYFIFIHIVYISLESHLLIDVCKYYAMNAQSLSLISLRKINSFFFLLYQLRDFPLSYRRSNRLPYRPDYSAINERDDAFLHLPALSRRSSLSPSAFSLLAPTVKGQKREEEERCRLFPFK